MEKNNSSAYPLLPPSQGRQGKGDWSGNLPVLTKDTDIRSKERRSANGRLTVRIRRAIQPDIRHWLPVSCGTAPAGGVPLPGFQIQRVTPTGDPRIIPVVPPGRGDGLDDVMAVLFVIPLDKISGPSPGRFDVHKTCRRIFRKIFRPIITIFSIHLKLWNSLNMALLF